MIILFRSFAFLMISLFAACAVPNPSEGASEIQNGKKKSQSEAKVNSPSPTPTATVNPVTLAADLCFDHLQKERNCGQSDGTKCAAVDCAPSDPALFKDFQEACKNEGHSLRTASGCCAVPNGMCSGKVSTVVELNKPKQTVSVALQSGKYVREKKGYTCQGKGTPFSADYDYQLIFRSSEANSDSASALTFSDIGSPCNDTLSNVTYKASQVAIDEDGLGFKLTGDSYRNGSYRCLDCVANVNTSTETTTETDLNAKLKETEEAIQALLSDEMKCEKDSECRYISYGMSCNSVLISSRNYSDADSAAVKVLSEKYNDLYRQIHCSKGACAQPMCAPPPAPVCQQNRCASYKLR